MKIKNALVIKNCEAHNTGMDYAEPGSADDILLEKMADRIESVIEDSEKPTGVAISEICKGVLASGQVDTFVGTRAYLETLMVSAAKIR